MRREFKGYGDIMVPGFWELVLEIPLGEGRGVILKSHVLKN